MKPETLDAKAFRGLLRKIAEKGGLHVIGQKRSLAQAALDNGQIPEGSTVTFHDDLGDDAYCLCKVVRGKLVVLYKFHGDLTKDDLN
jgi:hypothetical protein